MKDSILRKFIYTILVVFVMLSVMMTYIFYNFYKSSVESINDLGISNLKLESALIDNYLNKGMDVLWVTADTVDFMLEQGRSNGEILDYLTTEAIHEMEEVDENFTGIYGWINGEYLDGIGWVPPEDYVPVTREWYVAAKEAKGKPVIVAPYLDAQTNTIMISVSMLLRDNVSVISLDIALNEIQNVAKDLTMNDNGYGFIMDKTGLVVAHFNEEEKGKIYPFNEEQRDMVTKIYEQGDKSFVTMMDGEKCTVFSEQIQDDWYVVIVVSNTKLFEGIRQQVVVGIIVSLIVFALIVLFCRNVYVGIKAYQKKEAENQDQLKELNDNVIRALAYTIDAKDRYTSGHSKRVAEYAVAIAKRMGKSKEELDIIYNAGLLHDVGKIRVPEEVINKNGKLDDKEFDQIRIHPVSGYHILKDIHDDERIAFGAKYHHERYDGTGYPNGLAGGDIPEIARIIGVADAYDAMASNRSYRNALPQDVVRSEIERGKDKQFDGRIADVMLKLIDEDKEYRMCQQPKAIKSLLVIDDDKLNIKIIEKLFREDDDYKIIGATSKDKAFEVLETQQVDLILMDLMMPDINGFDLYELIRENYQMPVVLMTSDKSKETVSKINELGIDDYISKPLRASIFKETVHGIISGWTE